MVNYSAPRLDAVFAALADPTRRAILGRLARGEASVSEIARPFRISLPAVSRHLRVLGSAGLVVRKKEGRVHRVRLAAAPLKSAADWLEEYRQFWGAQLDSLADYLGAAPDEGVPDARA